MSTSNEPSWLTSGDGFIKLRVLAKPGSGRRGIVREEARGLVIALNSHAAESRANDELINFLAALLGIARSSVSIVKGHTTRVKTVLINGPEPDRILALLGNAIATRAKRDR